MEWNQLHADSYPIQHNLSDVSGSWAIYAPGWIQMQWPPFCINSIGLVDNVDISIYRDNIIICIAITILQIIHRLHLHMCKHCAMLGKKMASVDFDLLLLEGIKSKV